MKIDFKSLIFFPKNKPNNTPLVKLSCGDNHKATKVCSGIQRENYLHCPYNSNFNSSTTQLISRELLVAWDKCRVDFVPLPLPHAHPGPWCYYLCCACSPRINDSSIKFVIGMSAPSCVWINETKLDPPASQAQSCCGGSRSQYKVSMLTMF